MSGFAWTLPSPSLGTAAGGRLGKEIDRLYGKDIWLDLAAATGPNLVVDRTGDWLLATGEECLRQSLIRRFITSPGQWATKPDYGAGALSFVKKVNDKASRDRLAERLRSQALKDARVAAVQEVNVESTGTLLRLNVVVIPKARGDNSRPLRVAFELS